MFEIRAYHLLVLQVGTLDKRWITSVHQMLRPSDPSSSSFSFVHVFLFIIVLCQTWMYNPGWNQNYDLLR